MANESSPQAGPANGKTAGEPRKQVSRPGPVVAQQPIRSEDLLQGGREVQILHAGELYRLTLTRAGKLILHK